MPDSDLVKLLEVTLSEYNKKLTDAQLNHIVEKASKSPLFLTAFCSDIRRAGIWEEVDLEIEKLIITSSEDSVEFTKLLNIKQEIYNIQLSDEQKDSIRSKGARNPMFLTALCSNRDKPDGKENLENAIKLLLNTSDHSPYGSHGRTEQGEAADKNQEYNTPVRHLFEFLINKWSHDYGEDFMKKLLGVIAVSKCWAM